MAHKASPGVRVKGKLGDFEVTIIGARGPREIPLQTIHFDTRDLEEVRGTTAAAYQKLVDEKGRR